MFNKWVNRKVTVFGLGKSGISALRLLTKLNADVSVVNEGEVNSWGQYQEVLQYIPSSSCFSQSNPHAPEVFAQADLIIISPGIPTNHPVLKKANDLKVKIWSEIELAFEFCRVPIIAVTGTNGKTTTVTMLGEVFKNAGLEVFVGGNIGTPFCDYIIEDKQVDYVILEVSSFQLETIEYFRPDVAIILNVFPNHGERYEKVDDYRIAKFKIAKNMQSDDCLFYPSDDEIISNWASEFSCQAIGLNTACDEWIQEELQEDFDLSEFKLYGRHNRINLFFVKSVVEVLKIDKAAVQKTINTFEGVPYRVQYIPSERNYRAFNDAKSTNWDATLAALRSVEKKEKQLFLILGGRARGQNDSITPHIENITPLADKILLIGETSEMLASELEGKIPYVKVQTLEAAINYADQHLGDGFLLFSPSFPSFDQFKNYQARGLRFTELIKRK